MFNEENEGITRTYIRGQIERVLDVLCQNEDTIENNLNYLKIFEPAITNIENAYVGFVIGAIHGKYEGLFNTLLSRMPSDYERSELNNLLLLRMDVLNSNIRDVMMK